MSIFPDHAHPNPAERNGAEPRAGSPERDPSRSEAERGSSQKPHRFDKFALRMAEGMINAIRVTLGVFSSPDKERWPFARLLDHLKRGRVAGARYAAGDCDAKISVSPAKFRKRSKQGQVTLGAKPADCTPYFRLGVKPAEPDSPEGEELEACASPSRMREGDRWGGPQTADTAPAPLVPLPRTGRGGRETQISSLDRRIAALEDVLAHPGKHGARMARALYRAEHESGGRLIAKSPDDRIAG